MKFIGTVLLFAVLIFTGGCAAGIGVKKVSPADRRSYGVADYSAGTLSSSTVNLLENFLLADVCKSDPARALAEMERLYQAEKSSEVVAALADAALQSGYRFREDAELSSRYFLAAAFYSGCYLKYLDDSAELYDEKRFRLIRINNLAVTELFSYLKSRGLERRSGFALLMPAESGVRQVSFSKVQYLLPVAPESIAQFTPCANYRTRGLIHESRVFGVGVPMVAELVPGCRDVGGVLINGLPVAVTLVAEFEVEKGGKNIKATFRYLSSRTHEKVTLGKKVLPLAADFSTPLAFAVGKPRGMNFIERTIKVAEAGKFTGLYHFEPFDDKRIPVVFVHGLMSDARTWSQMLNTLLNDPQVRRKYQFLGYAYSSGNPIFVSAANLRKELKALREALIRQKRSVENFDRMVLVGHSMGGLLSRLQISSCSEEIFAAELHLENMASFKKKLTSGQVKKIRELLEFQAVPFVKRVIFIAVPHKGSQIATTWVGRIGASLIRLPAEILRRNLMLVTAFFGQNAADKFRVSTGIDNLRPDDVMLQLLNKLPVSTTVPYHSIIGNRKSPGVPGGSDGVVPYASSHLDGAASELVVKSTHSVQCNPLAIQEVRRILLLHANQSEEKKK